MIHQLAVFFQTEPGHLLLFWMAANVLGTMPAPTKESGVYYIWLFRFANVIAANISRATGTTVEKSPNFEEAAKLFAQARANGGAKEEQKQ